LTRATKAELSAGTLGFARATVDTTVPINDKVAYRLNGMAEDSASRSSLIDSHKYLVAPALAWVIAIRRLMTAAGVWVPRKQRPPKGVHAAGLCG